MPAKLLRLLYCLVRKRKEALVYNRVLQECHECNLFSTTVAAPISFDMVLLLVVRIPLIYKISMFSQVIFFSQEHKFIFELLE